jgi:hypothetical protein
MGIVQAPSVLPGQVGVLGAIKYMVTTDSLATVTAAGYLNAIDLAVNPIFSSDVLGITYSYNINTNKGTFAFFTVSISNGVITLAATVSTGDVLLPVVSGDIAIFNGTTGQIKDSSVAFSNGTDTVSPLFHGTATAGDFVTVNSTNKTIQDSGAAPSAASQAFVVMSPGAVTTGDLPKFSDVNGTLADSGITAASVSALITQTGTINQVSVTLTPTQMVTAYDTPLTLIAAPGATKMIQIISAAVYTASTGHTAYATGTAPIIQYGTTAHGAGTLATGAGLVAGDITAAASQVRTLGPAASTAWTGTSNLPITFSNATGDYTGGTGTNVVITLVYQVLTATV